MMSSCDSAVIGIGIIIDTLTRLECFFMAATQDIDSLCEV